MFSCTTLLLSALLVATPAQAEVPALYFMPKSQEQFYFLDAIEPEKNWVWLEDAINYSRPLRARVNGIDSVIPSPDKAGYVMSIIPRGKAVWACVLSNSDDDPDGEHKAHLYKLDLDSPEQGWVCFAEINCDNGVPSLIVPLNIEGMFFAVSQCGSVSFLDENSKASLAAIFRLRGKKLEFVRCVEFGFDTFESTTVIATSPKIITESGNSISIAKHGVFENTGTKMASEALVPYLWPPGIFGNYLTLYGAAAGCIWAFDLDKGKLHHAFNLYGLKAEDLTHIDALNTLILGAAFDPKSGRLIVAKKDPKLVKIFLKMVKEDRYKNDIKKLMTDLAFFKESYDQAKWVVLDLESKTFEDYVFLDYPSMNTANKNLSSLQVLVFPDGRVMTNRHGDFDAVINEALSVKTDDSTKAETASEQQ
jgi:hypothetical protein